jgi:signal peptidase I
VGSGRSSRDYGIAIIAAVAIALVIRFYALEAYRIPTGSMRPALEAGDTIFVAKWPLAFDRKPKRGDVVVYDSPTDTGRDFIKRVLGVAGDQVEVRKGNMLLNGKPLALAGQRRTTSCLREALPAGASSAPQSTASYEVCVEPPIVDDFGPAKVPDGSVFVLGDLRTQSPGDTRKRRSWGIIPLTSLKGRARWIWLSVEPTPAGESALHLPNFRFERMLRRIE